MEAKLIDSLEPITINFDFSSSEVVRYNASVNADLSEFVTSNPDKSFYFIPTQVNAPSIDSIGYDAKSKTYYFFQITISKSHPLKSAPISSLIKSLNISINDVRLLFIVPESSYNSFPRQTLVPKLSVEKNSHFSRQIVAKIDNSGLMNFFSDNNLGSYNSISASETDYTESNEKDIAVSVSDFIDEKETVNSAKKRKRKN